MTRGSVLRLLAASPALLAACGDSPTGPPEPTVALVEIVSPIDTVMAQGRTLQLTARGKDAQGNPVAGPSFTWTSGSPAVASVSPSGLVTGVAAGATEIAAEVDGVRGRLRLRVVVADLPAITAALADPFLRQCLAAGGGAGSRVRIAVDSVTASAASGHLLAIRRNLAVARAAASTATAPDERVLLAVVDLSLTHAQLRLGF